MNATEETRVGESLREISHRVKATREFVTESVRGGRSLYGIEQGVLRRGLELGRPLLETGIQLQGNGDVNATYTTSNNRELNEA